MQQLEELQKLFTYEECEPLLYGKYMISNSDGKKVF